MAIYNDIQQLTLEHISNFELPLEKQNHQKEEYFNKISLLNEKGALIRNNCKSLFRMENYQVPAKHAKQAQEVIHHLFH